MISKLREKIANRLKKNEHESFMDVAYCTRCGAMLELQRGFESDYKYWICKGCGMLLYNPASNLGTGITWFCDACNAVMNDQEGFREDAVEWKCTDCGHINSIIPSEVYSSEDEFREVQGSPLHGLSAEDSLRLMMYEEIENIDGREDIVRVRNIENDRLYVKKYLRIYDESIFRYLRDNPVEHMPRIADLFLTTNCLIVIEENVTGRTLEETLKRGPLDCEAAILIAKKIVRILSDLHSMERPIIHRDIKPANIIIAEDGEVFLLDMNVAKWNNEDENEDTELLGTQYYAAPEQYGFGYTASSAKTDIYALGVLLNKMITGKFPKEKKAEGKIGDIIEKCICLEAERRYDDKELYNELNEL